MELINAFVGIFVGMSCLGIIAGSILKGIRTMAGK